LVLLAAIFDGEREVDISMTWAVKQLVRLLSTKYKTDVRFWGVSNAQ
jgi:hypothetical protein